jgi:CubicO group peptidase (beta-lactamase class C family)
VNGGRKSMNINMAAVDQIVKSEMDKQHIFGLSLGIIKDGKIIAVKGYGLANIEQSIPATEQTVYKIGSVSKQMIATAIMSFVQKNKLKLTDSLPAFFKDAPAAWNKITIRHLLNHTSGLPRESPISDNMKQQSDSLLIRAAYDSKLLFEPGTSWRYCNLGYFMLADIIRQLSGQPFPDFMQDQIFRKYGLNSTRTTSVSAIVKNRADGYVYKAADNIYKAADYIALRPSGAFLSNINDMVKWEMLLQSDKLLSKDAGEQMWNDKVIASSPGQLPAAYYGYGWDVNEYKGLRIVHHDGTLPGFASSYFRFIDSRSAIIILTNADNAYPKRIALQIADLVF